jgi:hypothetical protein
MSTVTPLPPPVAPPSGMPPILRTIDPGTETTGTLSPAASIEDGRLVLRASAPGALAGQPFAPDAFRDVIVDAVMSLVRGGMDDAYGVFVRQVAERSYLAFMVTPDGRFSLLMLADGASAPMAEGRLPVDAPFAQGLGAANRLTVVAAGPCLTCIVNGFVVTGVTVDARYKAGIAGALLVHLAAEPAEAVVALHWAQVRALLVDQG